MKTRFGLRLASLCFCLLFVACSTEEALRTGEVNIYKAVNDKPLGDRRDSVDYLILKPRGYAASDNSHKLITAPNEALLITKENLVDTVENLLHASRTAIHAMQVKGNQNTSGYKSLVSVKDRFIQLRLEIEETLTSEHYLEHHEYVKAIRLLNESDDYLLNLHELLQMEKQEKRIPKTPSVTSRSLSDKISPRAAGRPPEESASGFLYDLTFQAFGYPLIKPDYKSTPDNKKYFICESYGKKIRAATTPITKTLDDSDALDRYLNEYYRILEYCLQLSKAVDGSISKNKGGLINLMDNPEYKNTVKGLELTIRKARLINDRMRNEVLEKIQALPINFEKREFISRIEKETNILNNLTANGLFRKLTARKSEQSYISVILKELYIRTVSEGAGSPLNPQNWGSSAKQTEKVTSEILVAVNVRNEDTASSEAQTYPIIFEENYAPGHFLNRPDRWVYGPIPYDGKAIDINFTIVELDDLDNQTILNGFSALSATMSKFNPEYAALSPAVNALFGGILSAASENDKELDISFTLAGEEDYKKSDVDFLVTETGHYVVIKKENNFRNIPALDTPIGNPKGKESKRQLYRKLAYNPLDSKLYWKRNPNNIQENFKPENLFLSQTYAVFAITDEYTQQDNLGALLRAQLGKVVGERKAKSYLPNEKEIGEMIEQFDFTYKEPTQQVPLYERAGFEILAQKHLDELWETQSPYRRQFIVESLFKRATPSVRQAFGRDPEKWKKGSWYFDTIIGEIKLSESGSMPSSSLEFMPPHYVKIDDDLTFSPSTLNLFQDKANKSDLIYFVKNKDNDAFVHTTDVFPLQNPSLSLKRKASTQIETPYFDVIAMNKKTLSKSFARKYYLSAESPPLPKDSSGKPIGNSVKTDSGTRSVALTFEKKPIFLKSDAFTYTYSGQNQNVVTFSLAKDRDTAKVHFVHEAFEKIIESRYIRKETFTIVADQ